ncbi:MAG: hypothetical protein RL071_4863, partial [Pseudomonadota bacterium]
MRAHAPLALLLPVLLAGCSEQTLWGKIIVEDSGGDGEDGGGAGGAGDGGASDGGAADGGGDTGTSAACPLPVPDQVAISRPVWGESGVHFYVPRPSWALA